MGIYKSYEEKLLKAIWTNDGTKVKVILENIKKKNKTLELNEKNGYGSYYLLIASNRNNISIAKILIEYANNNNIILNLNKKDENNDSYPLLEATSNSNIELVKLFIEYSYKYNIILELNAYNKYGVYPLLCAIEKDGNNIIHTFNENESFTFHTLKKINNTEIIKLLIEYANNKNITLELNEKDKNGYFPILEATFKNNIEIVKILINYASSHNIVLNVNEKSSLGNYPLLFAVINNNEEMVQLLIEYANNNNLILDLNERNQNNQYPLLQSITNNNMNIVNLLIKYAKNHNIKMKLNKKDITKYNSNISTEILKLLQSYQEDKKKVKLFMYIYLYINK